MTGKTLLHVYLSRKKVLIFLIDDVQFGSTLFATLATDAMVIKLFCFHQQSLTGTRFFVRKSVFGSNIYHPYQSIDISLTILARIAFDGLKDKTQLQIPKHFPNRVIKLMSYFQREVPYSIKP